jgi:SAM-dependent methyltransferase
MLVSGLTLAHDQFVGAALSGLGYTVELLDACDNASLQFGKEFGNRGQCNPTYYTVGNLVKHLVGLRDDKGMKTEDIIKNFVFITAGACGPCRFGTYVTEYRKALRDAGFDGRLLGVDLSPDSVALAVARGVYDEVVVGDLQQPLRYDDDSVDAVVCVGVLTYVPDVAAIWNEFCRITRPGGVIVLTQRDDVWRERRCNDVLHDLEREGRWTALHLTPPASYLPHNADFGDEIRVRYLMARVRAPDP